MEESRTVKSLKNAGVTLFFYAINVILGFWSRKVFYDYLGSEVLGLDTTATTLFGFLNLAELGIGSAVGYFLYRPMYDHNYKEINEIVALQGWIYRRIATIVIIGAFVMMCFFPIIFKDIDLPWYYPYITFSVMLAGSMMGYFINYRQCVLAADQKGYKVSKVTSTASILFRVMLILLLPVVTFPFYLYVGTTFAGSLIGCIWLNHTIKKEYPWLHAVEKTGKQLLKEYPEILHKTKQIFVHRMTTFIVNQLSPLFMYAFTTLSSVAFYGNYLAVIDRAKDILKNAFASTANGIGNLIASRDNEHIQNVFWEIFDSRLCISFPCILVFGIITEPFISVWLSPDYLLGPEVNYLVCIVSCISINRSTVDSFIGGYGLFQDVWAPAVEAAINIGGCLLFGYFWGISGVILGTLLSTILIVCIWKPYFLFTKGFYQSPWHCYFLPLLKRLLLLGVNAAVIIYIETIIRPTLDNYLSIGLYLCILSIVIIPFIYGQFYLFSKGTRAFSKRMIGLVNGVYRKHRNK